MFLLTTENGNSLTNTNDVGKEILRPEINNDACFPSVGRISSNVNRRDNHTEPNHPSLVHEDDENTPLLGRESTSSPRLDRLLRWISRF